MIHHSRAASNVSKYDDCNALEWSFCSSGPTVGIEEQQRGQKDRQAIAQDGEQQVYQHLRGSRSIMSVLSKLSYREFLDWLLSSPSKRNQDPLHTSFFFSHVKTASF